MTALSVVGSVLSGVAQQALGNGVGANPVTILGTSLLAWWTADRTDLITLSGAQVTSWKDVVAGYDVVQGVSAARPLWSATSFNGAPGLTFDSVDDELTLASQPLPSGAAPCEMWGVIQQDGLPADTTTRRWFSYGGTSNNDSRFPSRGVAAGVNRSALSVGTGAAAPGANSNGGDFSTRHVHRSVVTGTQIRQSLDNGGFGADVACVPATGATRVRIGAMLNGIGFWHGKIRDVLVTSILTTEQEAALNAWALPRRML